MVKIFTVFEIGSIKFSNVICYESSMPQLLRGFVRNGAQFLTIEANDGWLGKSSGPYQHFELAKLRAIENRVPITRCANTGISGVINSLGKVEDKVQLGEKKILIAEIIPSQKLTFYTKFGDIFALSLRNNNINNFGISMYKQNRLIIIIVIFTINIIFSQNIGTKKFSCLLLQNQ